jgi:hypothetical protein
VSPWRPAEIDRADSRRLYIDGVRHHASERKVYDGSRIPNEQATLKLAPAKSLVIRDQVSVAYQQSERDTFSMKELDGLRDGSRGMPFVPRVRVRFDATDSANSNGATVVHSLP